MTARKLRVEGEERRGSGVYTMAFAFALNVPSWLLKSLHYIFLPTTHKARQSLRCGGSLGAMDALNAPFPSLLFSPPPSSSPSSAADDDVAGRVRRCVHIMITCAFAAVGSVVGAVTGGLIGLATESGLLRGAGIGAISGAVFTIDASESGMWSLLYMVDVLCSVLSGRLVREKVGPEAIDSPLIEAIDIFDTGGAKGMARESVDRLPKVCITAESSACCVVCLQDFEAGETVMCLPHCQHKFHLPCIDGWLTVHGSCPLCRRDF